MPHSRPAVVVLVSDGAARLGEGGGMSIGRFLGALRISALKGGGGEVGEAVPLSALPAIPSQMNPGFSGIPPHDPAWQAGFRAWERPNPGSVGEIVPPSKPNHLPSQYPCGIPSIPPGLLNIICIIGNRANRARNGRETGNPADPRPARRSAIPQATRAREPDRLSRRGGPAARGRRKAA